MLLRRSTAAGARRAAHDREVLHGDGDRLLDRECRAARDEDRRGPLPADLQRARTGDLDAVAEVVDAGGQADRAARRLDRVDRVLEALLGLRRQADRAVAAVVVAAERRPEPAAVRLRAGERDESEARVVVVDSERRRGGRAPRSTCPRCARRRSSSRPDGSARCRRRRERTRRRCRARAAPASPRSPAPRSARPSPRRRGSRSPSRLRP